MHQLMTYIDTECSFFSHAMKVEKYILGIGGGYQDKEFSFLKKEIKEANNAFRKWREELFSGKLTFKKCAIPSHCKYCFLDDCEKV